MNKEPKVLLFDIETTPNLAWVWAKYQQDVIDYAEEWGMLCYCWKWLGQKTVHSASLNEYKDEEGLVKKLWELFDEADIIIAHNGDAFDIKKTNAKFVEHGMKPPSGYVTIDTKKVAKKYFRFNSNSLNDLGVTLNLGKKIRTDFDLWLGCMRNESQSWKKMIQYCKQDVALLEKVYYKLRPWMTNHPNRNVFTGHSHSCPICSSKNTQKRGFSITRVGRRQRYQCTDCGGWSVGEIIRTEVVTR